MRRRFRHWIYALSAILALALLFVHTRPAKTSVRHILSRWLTSEIGGSAQIAELDYRLWRGEVDMADLRWEAPSFRLAVKQIKVSWRPLRGIEIQIQSPQFVVQQTDATPPDPVAVPMVTPSLAAIEIHDGELQIRKANDEPWFWVSSVDVKISSTNGTHVGKLTAPNGRVVVPGDKDLSFGPLQIDFGIEPQKLAITNAKVEKADSHLQAQGEITSISPLAMDLGLDYRLDQEVANELVADLKLSGTLEGQAHLTADARRPARRDGFCVLPFDLATCWTMVGRRRIDRYKARWSKSLAYDSKDMGEQLVLMGASISSINATLSRPTFRRSTSAH